MARYGIKTRVIEKRKANVRGGHADGIQCRSLEILESFDLVDRIVRESCHMAEVSSIDPESSNPGDDGLIHRASRMSNTIPGISRFPCGVLLAQHRIEAIFLEELGKYPKVNIERDVTPVSIEIDRQQIRDHDSRPITVKLRQAAGGGLVPALNGVIGDESHDNKQDDPTLNRDHDCHETIRAKYVIGCDGAHSWTRAQLGFHMEGEQTEFIWGVLDTCNLGWKLALVIKGLANPSILKTYESERRGVAKELIAFDQEYSKLWSSRPTSSLTDKNDNKSVSMTDFERAFIQQQLFSSGFGVCYSPSVLTANTNQQLANATPIGKRFPSFRVINHSDARSHYFASLLKATGQFHIILFAGDVSRPAQMRRVNGFCDRITRASKSLPLLEPLHRDGASCGLNRRSIATILTLHSAPRRNVEFHSFPPLLRPYDNELGYDYDRIFADEESYYEGHGRAYEGYGVDAERGCALVVRPDGHVAWIGEVDDGEGMVEWLGGFLVGGMEGGGGVARG
ncbi:MAG: hypothetical protein Q9170_004945 [Blastenia crenularia]